MQLADFEQTGHRAAPRLVTRVADAAGAEEFELTLAGPPKLVEEMLADATIDLAIDSRRTQDDLLRDYEPVREEGARWLWELAGLEDLDALLKPEAKRLQRSSTVFAATRPVSGHGTPFAFSLASFFVPRGVSFIFFGPAVLVAWGSVRPASGDQDLFLRMFAPLGPLVASSRRGGTTLDSVAFGNPLFPWVPVFQVLGFTAGVCSVFTAAGV